ncbi:heme exporter protein D [Friedmanniella endophytica]|uniref:Heme exporter protein D n=1 Tax=Microlunatus kandeliicorticis TaxID=1759536 RepID=A0A7W3IRL4_9ACTN|nr:hypothetical protein [Microlunatus kandeliicorticis]MBA8793957.1 heme exporter protein D [Microlunatus kandeliicorticis]
MPVREPSATGTDELARPPGRPPADHGRRWSPFGRADHIALASALVLIALASGVGFWLDDHGFDLVLPTPPLLAFWSPHVGWGTPLALLALLLGLQLQRRAAEIRWGRLLLLGWLLNLGWLVSLTLVDGFRRGWVDVLLDPNEYLHDLPRITDVHTFLSTFSEHIRYGDQPAQAWTTHVAGHPPLATLAFWALDRLGLSGGFWAGALCILVGSAAATALVVLVRELAGEEPARRLLPLAALFPGAVWIGVSADGLFAGVALSGLALTAVALTRGDGELTRRPRTARASAGLAGGLLLGATAYLSYGLVLLGVVVLLIVACGWRRRGTIALRDLGVVTGGALLVAAAFTLAGFDWFTGLAELSVRYRTSVASQRPYGYFVWANLAAFLISCSPLLAVAVVRSVAVLRSRADSTRAGRRWSAAPEGDVAVALLCLSGVTAALIADISGMSKAETERIWLSFGVVAFSGLALLRGRAARWALIGSAGTALLVNHLLDTGW